MSQPCTAHRLLPAAILLAFGSLAGSVQAADWGGTSALGQRPPTRTHRALVMA